STEEKAWYVIRITSGILLMALPPAWFTMIWFTTKARSSVFHVPKIPYILVINIIVLMLVAAGINILTTTTLPWWRGVRWWVRIPLTLLFAKVLLTGLAWVLVVATFIWS
ncbi:MAG: hypothetical protein ACT4PL_02080, partial [Phycisphaerales bacterium]